MTSPAGWRAPQFASGPWTRRTGWLLVLLAALGLVGISQDFGITWDEGVQATYGELVLDYFASGGRNQACNEYFDLRYYGPLFESAAALVYRTAGRWKYEIRHAAIALTALLTLVAVWRYGRLCGSPAVAVFSVLALLMMPRFVGHAFNNSKDIPFACGFAWGMVGIGRLLTHSRWSWSNVALCGAGIGLALSVRVGALMLLLFLAIGVVAMLLLVPEERRSWRERPAERVIKLATITTLAWSIMVIAWPWALGNPLVRPLAALAEMSSFSHSYATYFMGELVRSDELPRYYLPMYLAIATPLVTLGLALLGLGATLRKLYLRPRNSITVLNFMALLWLFFPLTYVLVVRPNVYDGIRHFLFLLPAIAILCGLGAAWALDRMPGAPKWLTAGVLLVLISIPLKDLVSLHPYQASYFNATVGGLRSAWRNFESDYWASSYREAMQWILKQASEDSREVTTVVVACNSRNRPCAEYYLRATAPRISMHCVWEGNEPLPQQVDYYVGMLRYGKAASFYPDWPVVHRIGRQGAVFTVIRSRSPSRSRSPDPG